MVESLNAGCVSGRQDPPYFSVRPGPEYRQDAGKQLLIPCAASGDPEVPTITWRKVGQCIRILISPCPLIHPVPVNPFINIGGELGRHLLMGADLDNDIKLGDKMMVKFVLSSTRASTSTGYTCRR